MGATEPTWQLRNLNISNLLRRSCLWQEISSQMCLTFPFVCMASLSSTFEKPFCNLHSWKLEHFLFLAFLCFLGRRMCWALHSSLWRPAALNRQHFLRKQNTWVRHFLRQANQSTFQCDRFSSFLLERNFISKLCGVVRLSRCIPNTAVDSFIRHFREIFCFETVTVLSNDWSVHSRNKKKRNRPPKKERTFPPEHIRLCIFRSCCQCNLSIIDCDW